MDIHQTHVDHVSQSLLLPLSPHLMALRFSYLPLIRMSGYLIQPVVNFSMPSLATITHHIAAEHALDMQKQRLFVEMKTVPFGLGTWLM